MFLRLEKHDDILIATDPDRGEAIAKHIYDRLPKRGKNIKKELSSMQLQKMLLKEALKNPTDIDLNLYMSQTARRITDRIVGYMVSPVLWKKGSCQY